MAYTKNEIEYLRGILLLVCLTLPGIATTNIDCKGKPFHCINSTHFMICVDLGGGLSSTIDNFIIPCPPTTVCQGNNRFECEFPPPTIPQSVRTTDATKQLAQRETPASKVNDITTISPSSTISTLSAIRVIEFSTPKAKVTESKNNIEGNVKDFQVTNYKKLETTTNTSNITISDDTEVISDILNEVKNGNVERAGDNSLNKTANAIQVVTSITENISEQTTHDAVAITTELPTVNLYNTEILLDNILNITTTPKPLVYETITETMNATTEPIIINNLQPTMFIANRVQNSTQNDVIVTEINDFNVTKDLVNAYEVSNFIHTLKNPVDGKPVFSEKVIYADATTLLPETYIETTKKMSAINSSSWTTDRIVVFETETTIIEPIIKINDSLNGKPEPKILEENRTNNSFTKTPISNRWNESYVVETKTFNSFSISTPLPLTVVTTDSTNILSSDTSILKNQNTEERIIRFQNSSDVDMLLPITSTTNTVNLLTNDNETIENTNTTINKYIQTSNLKRLSTLSTISDVTIENISTKLRRQMNTPPSSADTTENSESFNRADVINLEIETSSTLSPSTFATTKTSNLFPIDTFTSINADRMANTVKNIFANSEQNTMESNIALLPTSLSTKETAYIIPSNTSTINKQSTDNDNTRNDSTSSSTFFPSYFATTEITNKLSSDNLTNYEQNAEEPNKIFFNNSNIVSKDFTKQTDLPTFSTSTPSSVVTTKNNESVNTADVTNLEIESSSTLSPSTFATTKTSSLLPTDTFTSINGDRMANTVENNFANSEQNTTDLNLELLLTSLTTKETDMISSDASTFNKLNTYSDNTQNSLTTSSTLLPSSFAKTDTSNILSSDTFTYIEQNMEAPIKIFKNDFDIQNKDLNKPTELPSFSTLSVVTVEDILSKDNMANTNQNIMLPNRTNVVIRTTSLQNDIPEANENITVPNIASAFATPFASTTTVNSRSDPMYTLSPLSVITTDTVLSTDSTVLSTTNQNTVQTNTLIFTALQTDSATTNNNVTVTEISSFSTLSPLELTDVSSILLEDNITESNSTKFSAFSPESYATKIKEDLMSTDNATTSKQMNEQTTLQHRNGTTKLLHSAPTNDAKVTELPLLIQSKVNTLAVDMLSAPTSKSNVRTINLHENYSIYTSNYGPTIASNGSETQLANDFSKDKSSTYSEVTATTEKIKVVAKNTTQQIVDATTNMPSQREITDATSSTVTYVQGANKLLLEYNKVNRSLKNAENINGTSITRSELIWNPLENFLLNTYQPSVLDISITTLNRDYSKENTLKNASIFVENITTTTILPNMQDKTTSLNDIAITSSAQTDNKLQFKVKNYLSLTSNVTKQITDIPNINLPAKSTDVMNNKTSATLEQTVATTIFTSVNNSASETTQPITTETYSSITLSYASNAFILPDKEILEITSHYPLGNDLEFIKTNERRHASSLIATQPENNLIVNTTTDRSPINNYLSKTTTASSLNTSVTHTTISTGATNHDNQEFLIANLTTLKGFFNYQLMKSNEKKSNTFTTVPTIFLAETTKNVNPVLNDTLITVTSSAILYKNVSVPYEVKSTDYNIINSNNHSKSQQTRNSFEVNEVERNLNNTTRSLEILDLITEKTQSTINRTSEINTNEENVTSVLHKNLLDPTQIIYIEDKSKITNTSSNKAVLQYEDNVNITLRMKLTSDYHNVKENISMPIKHSTNPSINKSTALPIVPSLQNLNIVDQIISRNTTQYVSPESGFTISLPFTKNKFINAPDKPLTIEYTSNSNKTLAKTENFIMPTKETIREKVNNITMDIHGNAIINSIVGDQNDTFNTKVVSNMQKTIPLQSRKTHNNNYSPSHGQITKVNASNIPENKNISSKSHFVCQSNSRGRHADNEDCRTFYICLGKQKPVVGRCPVDTVFSEIRKQCTRNLSHCIRNNKFYCSTEGRFSDFLSDNIYYICVKSLDTFVRFKLQCLNGYYLNKTSVRCVLNKEESSQSESSYVDNSKNSSDQSASMVRDEDHGTLKSDFACEEEGKFADRNDCRIYFICSKNNKSEYRRKIRKCESDEIFHKEKKKCVDADSSEC